MTPIQPTIKGRGAAHNPPNRFEPVAFEIDGDFLDGEERPAPRTQYFKDSARSIIVANDSPDVGFTHSINVYRGCAHGCCYCYARPTHEYLGLSAGLDFETKIFVKEKAPELLRQEMQRAKWAPVMLAMSGVTDCYQPIERQLKLTRRCLQVLAEFRNPVGIVTKSHLVTRDIDVLQELASYSAAVVLVSITTLDASLSAKMEPRAASPSRRLAAVKALAEAGVPVGIMVAPVVPGLTDHEIPAILQAAADAGAQWAGYTTLRLPGAVAELFAGWAADHYPDRRDKILNRVRELRGGKLNDPRFGSRMRGAGVFADQFSAVFKLAKRRAGLNKPFPELSLDAFRRPLRDGEQLTLF